MNGQLRILLVEDDFEVAAGVAALLGESGAEVQIAYTGTAAEALVARFAPDVVVLDHGLPDLNGTEVCTRLRQRWPDLPVVFVSGDRPDLRTILEARPDCTAFLPKPYDGDALLQTIHRLTRRG